MSNADYVDWQGQTGKVYRYVFLDLSRPISAIAVNYAFVKAMGDNWYRPLYFGESDNARARIGGAHEKWAAAIALGMTHVMAHSTQGGEVARLDEERDLIARWQPVLNVQHRQAK
jgi:hypothetical protein